MPQVCIYKSQYQTLCVTQLIAHIYCKGIHADSLISSNVRVVSNKYKVSITVKALQIHITNKTISWYLYTYQVISIVIATLSRWYLLTLQDKWLWLQSFDHTDMNKVYVFQRTKEGGTSQKKTIEIKAPK